MVNFNASKELVDLVENYRQFVINDVISYRIENKKYWSKSADEKDYPKIITGCEWDQVRAHGRSNRGRCGGARVDVLHQKITEQLMMIAPGASIPSTVDVGDKRLNIGTCAEDDAATKVLNAVPADVQTNSLTFVFPFRPRTLEPLDCCEVCKLIFG